ncbi:hypothetical protein JCM3765_000728 [Sporobolomyces pararoseus]
MDETGGEEESEHGSEEESSDIPARGKRQVLSGSGIEATREHLSHGEEKSGLLQKQQFPAARDCMKEIRQLLSHGSVNLPAQDDVFDTSRKLLVHLYAYAEQQDFSIYRRSPLESGTWFKVVCSRGHSRWKYTKNGRCDFAIEGSKMNDGKWRIARLDKEHNHSIRGDETNDSEEGSSSSSSEEEIQIGRPRTSRKRRRRQSSSPLPPLRKHDEAFRIPSHPYRPRLNANRPPPRHFQPSTSASNSSQLSPLVKSFLPPSSPRVPMILLTLKSLGIVNVETLTSILKMESSRFDRFVREIGDAETEQLLKAMATDLRRAL